MFSQLAGRPGETHCLMVSGRHPAAKELRVTSLARPGAMPRYIRKRHAWLNSEIGEWMSDSSNVISGSAGVIGAVSMVSERHRFTAGHPTANHTADKPQ